MGYEVDRKPATWLRRKARRERRNALLLVAVIITVLTLASIASFSLNGRPGTTPWVLAIGVLSISLAWLADRFFDDERMRSILNWRLGADSEEAIGMLLEQLRPEYQVMHDLVLEGETGNIDHLVAGPSGVFMIETKTRGFVDHDLRRATGRATRLGRELGVYVTAVIALHRRKHDPWEQKKVAIVPEQHLLAWIRSQHGKTVPFERLARLADRVR
jgi:hypothetical protein